MQKTSIAYADYSCNPIRFRRKDNGKMGHACIKCSLQCLHCYSAVWNRRFGTGLPYDAESMKLVEPVLIKKELDALERAKGLVFVEDMSDLFGPFVPKEMRDAVLDVLCGNKKATFLLLTKWTGIMQKHLSQRWNNSGKIFTPPENIWIGVTYTGEKSVNDLLKTPAAVRWVSAEPLLESVDFEHMKFCNPLNDGYTFNALKHGEFASINLVVVGCESGVGRRMCYTNWIREIVEQCKRNETACYVKQIDLGHAVTDNPALFPSDIRVRDYPA